MKRQTKALIFLIMILTMLFNSVTAFAAEDESSYSSTAETSQAVATTLIDESSESSTSETSQAVATTLKIDNQNTYTGMACSYSSGYTPQVSGNRVKVVLPLVSSGEIKNNSIIAKATMDFSEESPFSCKNYEKTITLSNNKISNKTSVSGYLVVFDIELLETRKNGNYPVTISVNAFDKDNNTVTYENIVFVSINDGKSSIDKTLKMQFDELQMPTEVTVSDVVQAPIKAMNLSKGKVYNVRATMSGDGLVCKSTAYFGDMEPGTSMDSSFTISVTSLSGDSLYGSTKGTVTFVYEDENGNEYTVQKPFSTNIKSPFTQTSNEVKDKPNQWWIIMVVVIVIIILIIAVYLISFMKKRGKNNYDNN